MNIHNITGLFTPYFRRKRAILLMQLMPMSSARKILDVGGYPQFWSNIQYNGKITTLNLHLPSDVQYDQEQFECLVGDARAMQFENNEFDIIFSNSVIEHVGDYSDQIKFANEIRRTGKHYWVQTPNKYFFVEPHLIAFFIHWLPISFQMSLIRWFSVWGIVQKPTKTQIKDFLDTTRLITISEMKELFPDATIINERFLFLKKSIIAYR